MAKSKLNWRGRQLLAAIKQGAANGLTEINLQIEAEAKAELFPGHGKLTGTMQRSIQGAPGRVAGSKVVGSVGTKGVRYALRQHRHFQYITNGLGRVRPKAASILAKHVKASGNG